MPLKTHDKAPFPWFGGKSAAAPHVWAALGDVDNYCEPFAGSLAVLLQRPHTANRSYYSETVNDIDGLLVNAWRAIAKDPDAVADAASWPVSEADKHARHLALVRWKNERQLEHLMGDPDFCDPKMAGWWLWGQCCWIGGGWCSGRGPWLVGADGRIERRPRTKEPGVSRQPPHLSNDGRGVNAPQMREPGVCDASEEPEYHPMTMPELRRWMRHLSARLRHVRILNGDWARALTSGALKTLTVRSGGVAGVFLDPPYGDTAGRTGDIYAHESMTVAHDVRAWCVANGSDPRYRIVLAGFDTEHTELDALGWRCVEWFRGGFLKGGMGNISGNGQMHRDRLWLSPHCLDAAATPPAPTKRARKAKQASLPMGDEA